MNWQQTTPTTYHFFDRTNRNIPLRGTRAPPVTAIRRHEGPSHVVDNQEAVKIGDLEKTLESLLVVDPNFSADSPDASVREGADAPTLRRGEDGTKRNFIHTATVGDNRWEPPLVDED